MRHGRRLREPRDAGLRVQPGGPSAGRSRALRHAGSSESWIHRVGTRLRARRFAEGSHRARQDRQSDGSAGAEPGCGGAILSGDLLVFDAQDPAKERVPRGESGTSGRVAERREERRLQRLPRDGHPGHAHDAQGLRPSQALGRGMGATHPIRASPDANGPRHHPARCAARAQLVRRLDRSDRRGRAAVRDAGAAARDRAQRRPHPLGLEPPHGLPPRLDRDRPAQPHDQSQRQILRVTREQHGLRADPRSHHAYGDRGAAPGARSEDAVPSDRSDGALAVLGSGTDLGQPDQQSQPDDGRKGTCLVHRPGPAPGQS